MARYKDAPKINGPITDGYVGGPVPIEPAIRESREIFIPVGEETYLPVSIPTEYEKALSEIREQLTGIKKDLEDLKSTVEKMDRVGLRMRPAF